ncbi:hypothetical protein ACIA49_17430 [Kribbella sp. NPDC051587]|uniref:hypothetical protein n=1 Tax=Kribbella sp. NPDC051587 TaxID=3364119 RepID=UPI0037BA08FB
MIAKLAATALLLTTLTVPAHATTLGCTMNVLEPAPGTPSSGTAWVTDGDDTGHYLLGESTLPDHSGMRPVLWTNGVPRWLDRQPGVSSTAVDVNNDGTVVGYTGDETGGSHPWTWSGGSYKDLAGPAGLEDVTVSAINNRGDIAGYGWDPATFGFAGVVWPKGGAAIRLDAKWSALVVDINEKGIVVGNVQTPDGNTGWIWTDWQSAGSKLPGKQAETTRVQEIRGDWIGGKEPLADGTWSGLVWNLATLTVESRERPVNSINTTGDVAIEPSLSEASVIVKADGSRVALPEWSNIYHLFDRGRSVSAGGYDGHEPSPRAITWSGCFPPDHS